MHEPRPLRTQDSTPTDGSAVRSPSQADSLPPIVAWVSRHSGWLIFLTILTVALLEGVGIYHIKRRANERSSAPATAPASPRE